MPSFNTPTFELTQSPSPATPITASATQVRHGLAASESILDPLPKLFQPLKIRNITFKNRLWVSPMCMYSAEDGFVNDFHFMHYGQFAVRGSGGIVIEATGVVPEGRITPNCLGLWKDEQIAGLRHIVDYAHKFGTTIGIQIGHAGRKSSTIPLSQYGKRPTLMAEDSEGGWSEDVYGPSAIAYDDKHWTPKEMTIEQIADVQQAFVDAAVRAEKAGFDFIELHGAHGYLIHQFYSPLSNQRTDKYGGSFENRIRFFVETARKVRQVWPAEKPLLVRVSASDCVEGGWDTEDTVELAKILHNEGVDFIDCSSAGNDPRQKVAYAPGYQVPYAAAVKAAVPGILVGAIGSIDNGRQANEILEQGKADVASAARKYLRDPSFVFEAAKDLGVFVKWNDQYERSRA
ncbi:FMN-linked oxidoreductase [Linderina pennispora]|uniref:FMN-linked oxidoreductase n=1 Tax=Linderina pennispora TaxID=61395 RepID=A0A1Y1W2H5_9FUNG|nr:FMN-linked oxidoreductase [Linderina pennispora]ORX67475.1 FMN-linked oxidoreductase [Linderina pennispora]